MTEFTLKSAVDFLENSGFHVRAAEEVGIVGQTFSLGGKELATGCGAIRLEIAPKMGLLESKENELAALEASSRERPKGPVVYA